MKNLLKAVRDSIAAAMSGRTVEEMENDQRKAAVKSAVDDFLKLHPADYLKPAGPKAATTSPVTKKRVMKTLGAGAGVFTPHFVDEAALARARAKCREIIAADPDRYGDIISDSKGA